MERYIIKANKIIARDQLEVMENSGLLIENGKINHMGKTADVASPGNFKEIFEIDSEISHDDRFGLNVTLIGRCKT